VWRTTLQMDSIKPQVLLVGEVRRFELLWMDKGCGKKIPEVSFFRPIPPDGYYSLGDVARPYNAEQPKLSGDEQPVFAVAEGDSGFSHFLRQPIDYQIVWNTTHTKSKKPASIWKPVAPPGFVALGYVVSKGHNKPLPGAVRCIHRSLVLPAALPKADQSVWRDQGSGGKYDVSIYNVITEHGGRTITSEDSLPCGGMVAVPHYRDPKETVYALNKSCLIDDSTSTVKTSGAVDLQLDGDTVTCPKCQGKGNWGVFGGCDFDSVHLVCRPCPMCRGKCTLKGNQTTLCRECGGFGGKSAFGQCTIMSLHHRPCTCGGTGLAL